MAVERMGAVLDHWGTITLQLLAAVIASVIVSEIARIELTHLWKKASSRKFRGGAAERLLKVGEMKEINDMIGAGCSTREIALRLGNARDTVRRYLKTPEAVKPKPRQPRGSTLDPYMECVNRRMAEGLQNCVVLCWELQRLGHQGAASLVKRNVSLRLRRSQVQATVRFETGPGEQAQVDWGSLAYVGEDGRRRQV